MPQIYPQPISTTLGVTIGTSGTISGGGTVVLGDTISLIGTGAQIYYGMVDPDPDLGETGDLYVEYGGPVGEGEAGAGAATFTYIQSTPSNVWVITHGLGTFPSVTVTDSSGNWVIGSVHYDSVDQVTITFSSAFSGTAVLV